MSEENSNCLFCKIAQGEIKASVIYEDPEFLAFKDIHPKAPVHILVIPKIHRESLADLTEQDAELMGRLTCKLKIIAESQGLKNGFRTIINTGPGGGQEIGHIHYHVLGGGPLLGFK